MGTKEKIHIIRKKFQDFQENEKRLNFWKAFSKKDLFWNGVATVSLQNEPNFSVADLLDKGIR
jgi:hypothetical protein